MLLHSVTILSGREKRKSMVIPLVSYEWRGVGVGGAEVPLVS